MAYWLRSEQGQDMVEYALLVVLLVIVVAVAISPVGGNLAGLMADAFEAVQAFMGG
jgi:Flp pilus assembly pilin Flp